jgi:ketosteroid isomerase-like protein
MKFQLLICLLLTVASSAEAEDLPSAEQALARDLAGAGPVAGFVDHLAREAVYLHPGAEAVLGRDAIAAQLAALYPGSSSVVLHPLVGDVSSDGLKGYRIGWLEQTDDGTLSYAKYIAAWTTHQGCWKIEAFARVNSTAPATTPPAGTLLLDGEQGSALPGDPQALALEIARADAAFAQLSVDAGYTVAFSAYTSDAAVIVAGSDFFWDRAGVETAWAGWTPVETLSWSPLRAVAAGSGDFGWSIGYARYRTDDGQTIADSYSKYLSLWLRAADGGWRFIADGGNARPAP